MIGEIQPVLFNLGTGQKKSIDENAGFRLRAEPSSRSVSYKSAAGFGDEAIAIAAVAGTIAVIALVAGGAYFTYQIAETTKVAGGIINTGAEAGKIAVKGASDLSSGIGGFISKVIP